MSKTFNRLSFEEGLELFQQASIRTLADQAHHVRCTKSPPNRVTFVVDSNPNYTNLCNADCSFCGFYRHRGAKDFYKKSVDDVMKHLDYAYEAGCSTVLLQGGLADYPLDFYVELVRQTRARYPSIVPHFFTAPEIWNCAKVNHCTLREVLEALWEAGQRTLPGGGAEILSEKVRLAISPKKMEPDTWIEVHQTAHEIGFLSTATMMYGHVETAEDILIHLEAIRKLQDRTGGFTAFIPWSYKRDRTALRRTVKHWAGKDAYLRIIAFARLYLDNFDHIQASWFSEGAATGIQALQGGADDFGGLILEENVHRATGFVHRANIAHVVGWIRDGGFLPAERNALYTILKVFNEGEAIEVPKAQEIHEPNRLAILDS